LVLEKNNYFKTLKSDTHLRPVNRTRKIDGMSDGRKRRKYIEMLGSFTDPFNCSEARRVFTIFQNVLKL